MEGYLNVNKILNLTVNFGKWRQNFLMTKMTGTLNQF